MKLCVRVRDREYLGRLRCAPLRPRYSLSRTWTHNFITIIMVGSYVLPTNPPTLNERFKKVFLAHLKHKILLKFFHLKIFRCYSIRKIEGGIDRISTVSFCKNRFCTLLKCVSFIFISNIYVSDSILSVDFTRAVSSFFERLTYSSAFVWMMQ